MNNAIGIHEKLLVGGRLDEKLRAAREDGIDGVEFDGRGLAVDGVMRALAAAGLRPAALIFGDASDLLHPDPAQRARALEALRLMVTDAGDLGAPGVLIAPFMRNPGLPDLSPYKAPAELALDLLVEHLRWLEDYAAAHHTALLLHTPALALTAQIAARRNNHPHIKACVQWGADDAPDAEIAAHASLIGYARLEIDDQGAFPRDPAPLRAVFGGWLALTDDYAADMQFPAEESTLETGEMPAADSTDSMGVAPLPTGGSGGSGAGAGGEMRRISGGVARAARSNRTAARVAIGNLRG